MVQLNVYQRVVDISCWYLTGYFYFHCFEIQQAQRLLEKWKLEKRRVTSPDLEIIHEIYLNVKKTYPENSESKSFSGD